MNLENSKNSHPHRLLLKGPYIKYIGGGAGGFLWGL